MPLFCTRFSTENLLLALSTGTDIFLTILEKTLLKLESASVFFMDVFYRQLAVIMCVQVVLLSNF